MQSDHERCGDQGAVENWKTIKEKRHGRHEYITPVLISNEENIKTNNKFEILIVLTTTKDTHQQLTTCQEI